MRPVSQKLWEENCKAVGCRGNSIPDSLDKLIEKINAAHLSKRLEFTDRAKEGLYLRAGAARIDGGKVVSPGSRTWWLRCKTKTGQRLHYTIGDARRLSLAQARALADEDLSRVEAGRNPVAERARDVESQRTLRSFLEDVFAPRVLAKRRDGGKGTKARLLAVWAPILDVPLVHLTRDKIDDVLTGRKVKPATLRRVWNPLRRLLREANEREAIPAELARKILRRPDSLAGLTPDEPRERWLGDRDEGEPARFEAALSAFTSNEPGGGDFCRFAVRLALSTGLRRGEIVRLTDAMVNLKERTITLPAAITKGNKPRTIDLHDKAVAAIQLWRGVRAVLPVRGIESVGEFCPGEKLPWERRLTAQNREFHRLCREARIKDLRFHDLRHDFGVRFLRAGGAMEQLQKVLGHASIVTTAKHYGHAVPKDVRRAVLAMM